MELSVSNLFKLTQRLRNRVETQKKRESQVLKPSYVAGNGLGGLKHSFSIITTIDEVDAINIIIIL